jgi:hypothetical protein
MREILFTITVLLTRYPRYKTELILDKRIYIANIFRIWEYLFGRRFGIKKEASTCLKNIDGLYYIQREFYTLEARLTHYEASIRTYFSTFPSLSSYFFNPEINYQRGAIALDASAKGTVTATTPLTFSHTVTGSNVYLKVGVGITATSPTISTPTYNSVSMNLEDSQATNVANMAAMYNLVGPSTGSNTVSVGFGGTTPNCDAVAVSYSGVKQSGQPDATKSGTGAGAPSITVATVADNCWSSCVVSAISVSGGSKTTRQGVITLSGTHQMEYQDTNGVTTPAGNVTFAWSAGTTTWAAVGGSFSPVAAVTTKPLLSLLGAGL